MIASASIGPITGLYLVTPEIVEVGDFPDTLAAALDAGPVQCVRLRARGQEAAVKRTIETLRPICHDRNVALVISDYFRLAAEMGLDGVHFEPGANHQREARDHLGTDAIIGVGCGASKHHGMIAAERGADYVAFGPLAASPTLYAGELADPELFAWWQEMIETPVVAEGGMSVESAAELVGAADFIAACSSVWDHPDGAAAGVRAYIVALDPK